MVGDVSTRIAYHRIAASVWRLDHRSSHQICKISCLVVQPCRHNAGGRGTVRARRSLRLVIPLGIYHETQSKRNVPMLHSTEKGKIAVNKSLIRRIAGAIAVAALLAAGYAGMQLAPTIHATTSAVSHSQIAGSCVAGYEHC